VQVYDYCCFEMNMASGQSSSPEIDLDLVAHCHEPVQSGFRVQSGIPANVHNLAYNLLETDIR
jgi:hypothetical protein